MESSHRELCLRKGILAIYVHTFMKISLVCQCINIDEDIEPLLEALSQEVKWKKFDADCYLDIVPKLRMVELYPHSLVYLQVHR
jgi:hypothetical protein